MVSLACARISWTFMVSPSIARSVPRHRAAVHDPCHGYDLVACLYGAPHQPCSRCLASGEAQARRQTLYLGYKIGDVMVHRCHARCRGKQGVHFCEEPTDETRRSLASSTAPQLRSRAKHRDGATESVEHEHAASPRVDGHG